MKLILMDLDGSTLNEDGVVPNNLSNVILKNHLKHHWSICTGRSYKTTITTSMAQLPINGMNIMDGGGLIANINGELLKEFHLTDEDKDLFFKFIVDRQEQIKYIFASAGLYENIMFSTLNNVDLPATVKTNDLDEFKQLLGKHNITKISLRLFNKIDLQHTKINWNINESNLDVTSVNVNKGSSVYFLLKHIKVEPQDTIFIFNDYNDLPVITHPYLKNIITIKVGNKLDTPSSFEVDSPDEVADILLKLL